MKVYIDPKVPDDVQEVGRKKLAALNLKARFVELIYHPGLKQFRVFDADTRKTIARFDTKPDHTAETPGETGGTGDDDVLNPATGETSQETETALPRRNQRPAGRTHKKPS